MVAKWSVKVVCQGKIEMSYSRQSRNVVLGQVRLGRRVSVGSSARGRARADAQGRCDGAGSEEIGCRPSADKLVGRGFCF